jgi:anthranilate phosphoribosyltransferase
MIDLIKKVVKKENLNERQAFEVMLELMKGNLDDIQITALLVGLRSKGETVDEITGFAKAMRKTMIGLNLNFPAIDMCGTGGDYSGTFNISTASSIVVAGSGIKVAKHGNRSMTSKSGSADVLEALNVDINKSNEDCIRSLEKNNICFMFAPNFHPAVKNAMNVRSKLKIKTVFNILGPLCNPANVKNQAMGVFEPSLTEIQTKVLKNLGSKNVMVFNGDDGLDELTTTCDSNITYFLNGSKIINLKFDPRSIGISLSKREDLKGSTANINAKIILDILNGKKGPQRDIVLLNAAAGIMIGGKATSLKEGYSVAEESVDSLSALKVLKGIQK